MTVRVNKPAVNLREELASLRNQGGYSEQQFYFDGLITNGTFDTDTDWTKGTGWTIGSGVATCDGSVTSDVLYQSHATTSGASYIITFEITAFTSGAIIARAGNVRSTDVKNTVGVHSATVIADGQPFLGIEAENTFVGSIDNVSVFELDANGDVTHTMPKGWKPKDVFEHGLLQREGAANDYEVVYDGFDYKVKPTVAPTATTETCVIGVKA